MNITYLTQSCNVFMEFAKYKMSKQHDNLLKITDDCLQKKKVFIKLKNN